MKRVPIGIDHGVWQLALSKELDVQYPIGRCCSFQVIRDPRVRTDHMDRLSDLVDDRRDCQRKIRVVRNHHRLIISTQETISHQQGGQVDVRPLFFKNLDLDLSASIALYISRNSILGSSPKLTFDNLDLALRPQSVKENLLPRTLARIVALGVNISGAIVDITQIVLACQPITERPKIKPLQVLERVFSFPIPIDAVVEIEAIDIAIDARHEEIFLYTQKEGRHLAARYLATEATRGVQKSYRLCVVLSTDFACFEPN
jgi:hypothetical protein